MLRIRLFMLLPPFMMLRYFMVQPIDWQKTGLGAAPLFLYIWNTGASVVTVGGLYMDCLVGIVGENLQKFLILNQKLRYDAVRNHFFLPRMY